MISDEYMAKLMPKKYKTIEIELSDYHKYEEACSNAKLIELPCGSYVISEINKLGSACAVVLMEVDIIVEKPRTKVEYVKVTDSIFHLKPDFEAGDLYYWYAHGQYMEIKSLNMLASKYAEDKVYRRVEREITWQDELDDWIDDCIPSDDIFEFGVGGFRMDTFIPTEHFVKMCHLVASMTDKPE